MPKQKRERTTEEALFMEAYEERLVSVEFLLARLEREEETYAKIAEETYSDAH